MPTMGIQKAKLVKGNIFHLYIIIIKLQTLDYCVYCRWAEAGEGGLDPLYISVSFSRREGYAAQARCI